MRLRANQVLAVDVGLSVGTSGGKSGMAVVGAVTGGADSVTAGELVRRTIIVRTKVWDSSRHQRRAAVTKGVDIELSPLDEGQVRAKITWSEQDVGGGKLVVEVTVKNMKSRPKTDEQLRSDAKALAVRFARAFADTIEN
jgi:hypothetical protein